MLSEILLIIAVAIVLSEQSPASARASRPSDTFRANNANYIFNAIHSSMRQWGSSLNHNGMSFFPAYMPAGTELYHGTGTPDRVDVMEWLAFEPEHALNFAWKIPDELVTDDIEIHDSQSIKWLLDSDWTRSLIQQTSETGPDDSYQRLYDSLQRPIPQSGQPSPSGKPSPPKQPPNLEPGWLHTYVIKHDLRLLYIDGQSAAKSTKGTLDSQDFIFGIGGHNPIWFDRWRALHMCKIAKEKWDGSIDGFIRMEHGFELILCDFVTNADLVRVERVNSKFATDGAMSLFWFLKAITARYHGIGTNRVLLDYSRLVTAFAYDIELFSDSTKLPRLNNVERQHREMILTDLSKSVIQNNHQPFPQRINWQAVADMIVARYSDVLHELAYSDFYKSKWRTEFAVDLLLRPFIDYDHRDTSFEIQRCASHFMPSNYTPSIASAAVYSISNRICATLSAAAEQQSLDDARRSFQGLVEYLEWTSWKECRGCRYDELCFTAICMYMFLTSYPLFWHNSELQDLEEHTYP
ncbi:hypothetical protein MMC11_003232 [Xylographa trunciseda]|nr:hypothetical protein [Xylographa trunciseda]